MSEVVNLNGKFVARNEAFISPDDRGFNFADGVYEVVKYYRGKPFRFIDHINRLKRSLREIRIDFEDSDQFATIFQSLLESNNLINQEAGIYLQITRGRHTRMHRFPENITPTVFVSTFPFSTNMQQIEHGIKVVTAEDIRWLRCDIKSIALLPNVLSAQQAEENEAAETIFIRNGIVTEASHSNVLGVKNGKVYTHPDSNLILPGITKKVILEICKASNIVVIEQGIPDSDLFGMEEIMIVGTGSEVTPAVKIDDKIIGDGKPGPITRLVQTKFFEQTQY